MDVQAITCFVNGLMLASDKP